MLTIDDIQILTRKFRAEEHEFLNNYAYIKEGAITTRLDEVDPSWEFIIINQSARYNDITKQVIITTTSALTVKGITRQNSGTSAVQLTNVIDREKKKPYLDDLGNPKIPTEANEAEKISATDSLKRCARLFGIGRYLLDLPDNVKNDYSLARYLNGEEQPQQPQAQAPKQSAPVAAPTPVKVSEDGTISQMFNVLYKKAEYNQLSFKVGDDWLRVKLDDFLKLMPNPAKFAEWFAPLPDGKSALPRDLSVCYRHDGKKLVIVSVL